MFNFLNCYRIFSNGFCTLKTNKTSPHKHNVLFILGPRDKSLGNLRLRPRVLLTRVQSSLMTYSWGSKTVGLRTENYDGDSNGDINTSMGLITKRTLYVHHIFW